jgi:methylase of polypeptide subunit release factors
MMPKTMRYSAMPDIHWTEQDNPRHALWRSERGLAAPKRVQIADDTLSADAAYRLASEGVGLLWRGDFQNARHLLQALDRRLSKRATRKPRAGKPAVTAKPSQAGDNQLTRAFHQQRMAQAQRASILGSVLITLDSAYGVALRRAPDVRLACEQAWGPVPKGLTTDDAASGSEQVCSLRELLGIISAHEWRKKGVAVPELGMGRDKLPRQIHPHYGVFSPIRGEYIALVAKATLPLSLGPASSLVALDIGTGTGVLAAVLAQRGVGSITATELGPRALACAQDNITRLRSSGMAQAANVRVLRADLYPEPGHALAHVIVCNPPWLPARAGSALEQAVYDEGSQMLLGFLNGLNAHLAPGGEGWLILSDLAERIGLRSREQLLGYIAAAGLRVIERHDTVPKHAKAQDNTDALYAARSKEITSLWRLGRL